MKPVSSKQNPISGQDTRQSAHCFHNFMTVMQYWATEKSIADYNVVWIIRLPALNV
jgi:hypothetical protein